MNLLDAFLVKIAETELGKGVKVEAEHGDTIDWVRKHPKVKKREVYKHIAKDHLEESKHYYRDLKTMEDFADSEKEKQAQVDPYQQKTQWTCSAACLRAVLLHHGEDWPESILVPLIGAKEKRGAECDEIAEAARALGFMAFEYSFASTEHAKLLLNQDLPIICDIQSFKHPGKGHYVVLTKIDDEGVHIMDPNAPEQHNERILSIEEMDGRWWDHAMAPPHALMDHWGIVIVPSESTKLADLEELPEVVAKPIERGLNKVRVNRVAAELMRDVPGTGWSRKIPLIGKHLMKRRTGPEREAAGKAVTSFIAHNPVESAAVAVPGGSAYVIGKNILRRLRQRGLRKNAGLGGDASAYLPRGPSPSDIAQWSASMRMGKKKQSEIAADGMNKEQ